jgi:hypothetical protein
MSWSEVEVGEDGIYDYKGGCGYRKGEGRSRR